jgi:hypothetical protein
MKFLFFRSLLQDSQFSPLIDLERNDQTGLLRLIDHYCLGEPKSAKRLELFEKNLVKYFRSRDEDNIKKPRPTTNTAIITNRPISSSNEAAEETTAHSIDDVSFHNWLDDSHHSNNESFWNYPLPYQDNSNYETDY